MVALFITLEANAGLEEGGEVEVRVGRGTGRRLPPG